MVDQTQRDLGMAAIGEFVSADAPGLFGWYLCEAERAGVETREVIFNTTSRFMGKTRVDEAHRGTGYFLGRSHEPGGAATGHAKDHHRLWFLDDEGWLSSFTSYRSKPGKDGSWVTESRYTTVAYVEAFGPWNSFEGREPQRMKAATPPWHETVSSIEQARQLLNRHFKRHFEILLLEATPE